MFSVYPFLSAYADTDAHTGCVMVKDLLSQMLPEGSRLGQLSACVMSLLSL